jgi:hypothetical protein
MSNKKQTHIVPNSSGGWDSKDTGNSKASRHFETKQETIDWGRQHSRRKGNEFVIHNKKGNIAQKDSHGNDPCPPKDKN